MKGNGVIEPHLSFNYKDARMSDCEMQATSFEPIMNNGKMTYGHDRNISPKNTQRGVQSRNQKESVKGIAQKVVEGIEKGLKFKKPQNGLDRGSLVSQKSSNLISDSKTNSKYGQIYQSKMKQTHTLKVLTRQPSPSFPSDKQIFQNVFMLAQKEKRESRYSKPTSEKSSAKSSTKQIFLKRSLPKCGKREEKVIKNPAKCTLKKQLEKFARENKKNNYECRPKTTSKDKNSLNNSRSNGLTFRTFSSKVAEDTYIDGITKKKSLALQNTKTSSFLQRTSEEALLKESIKFPTSQRGKRDNSLRPRVVYSGSYKNLYSDKLATRQMTASAMISPSPAPSREVTIGIVNQAPNLCTYNKNHQKMIKKGKK